MEIKVYVKDKNTLVLDEDAKKGDVIRLDDINVISTDDIVDKIDKQKDKVYEAKLEEVKRQFEAKLRLELDRQRLEFDNVKMSAVNTVKNESRDEIERLRREVELLKSTSDNRLAVELTKKDIEKAEAINQVSKEFEIKIKEQDEQISILRRQKASLNVKQTGEDLEVWCDNEMTQYMQNGFTNCTWTKDNDVVRDEGESKGSKADFIFRVYATEEHRTEDELTSVCMDMKDENPDSVNKKKNSDHFWQLDQNRRKKNCKYAVLVSNLELDRPNDMPIYRVTNYPDMYVVRPAYMMTFLNLITSLTTRFVKLVTASNDRQIELKNAIALKEEFDKIKTTYLDNPLKSLTDHLEKIRKQGETIRKAAQSIDEECDFITRSYVNNIEAKINKFDVELVRAERRYDRRESCNDKTFA